MVKPENHPKHTGQIRGIPRDILGGWEYTSIGIRDLEN